MSDPRLTTFLHHVVDDNAVEAKKTFDDIMLGKINDLVNDRKTEVAANVIGGQEYEEIDEPEECETEIEEPEVEEPEEESNEQETEGNTEESGTDN